MPEPVCERQRRPALALLSPSRGPFENESNIARAMEGSERSNHSVGRSSSDSRHDQTAAPKFKISIWDEPSKSSSKHKGQLHSQPISPTGHYQLARKRTQEAYEEDGTQNPVYDRPEDTSGIDSTTDANIKRVRSR